MDNKKRKLGKVALLELRLMGYTYAAIAQKAGISRQRVQQLLCPPTHVRNFVVKKYGGKCKKCGVLVGQ
uniref:Uncharacterized protein n=1 Tax=viral metagenome TaxID=1070528 RepID=A0A6M3JRP5_9ZZZZ